MNTCAQLVYHLPFEFTDQLRPMRAIFYWTTLIILARSTWISIVTIRTHVITPTHVTDPTTIRRRRVGQVWRAAFTILTRAEVTVCHVSSTTKFRSIELLQAPPDELSHLPVTHAFDT
jgi:hypothetical protein